MSDFKSLDIPRLKWSLRKLRTRCHSIKEQVAQQTLATLVFQTSNIRSSFIKWRNIIQTMNSCFVITDTNGDDGEVIEDRLNKAMPYSIKTMFIRWKQYRTRRKFYRSLKLKCSVISHKFTMLKALGAWLVTYENRLMLKSNYRVVSKQSNIHIKRFIFKLWRTKYLRRYMKRRISLKVSFSRIRYWKRFRKLFSSFVEEKISVFQKNHRISCLQKAFLKLYRKSTKRRREKSSNLNREKYLLRISLTGLKLNWLCHSMNKLSLQAIQTYFQRQRRKKKQTFINKWSQLVDGKKTAIDKGTKSYAVVSRRQLMKKWKNWLIRVAHDKAIQDCGTYHYQRESTSKFIRCLKAQILIRKKNIKQAFDTVSIIPKIIHNSSKTRKKKDRIRNILIVNRYFRKLLVYSVKCRKENRMLEQAAIVHDIYMMKSKFQLLCHRLLLSSKRKRVISKTHLSPLNPIEKVLSRTGSMTQSNRPLLSSYNSSLSGVSKNTMKLYEFNNTLKSDESTHVSSERRKTWISSFPLHKPSYTYKRFILDKTDRLRPRYFHINVKSRFFFWRNFLQLHKLYRDITNVAINHYNRYKMKKYLNKLVNRLRNRIESIKRFNKRIRFPSLLSNHLQHDKMKQINQSVDRFQRKVCRRALILLAKYANREANLRRCHDRVRYLRCQRLRCMSMTKWRKEFRHACRLKQVTTINIINRKLVIQKVFRGWFKLFRNASRYFERKYQAKRLFSRFRKLIKLRRNQHLLLIQGNDHYRRYLGLYALRKLKRYIIKYRKNKAYVEKGRTMHRHSLIKKSINTWLKRHRFHLIFSNTTVHPRRAFVESMAFDASYDNSTLEKCSKHVRKNNKSDSSFLPFHSDNTTFPASQSLIRSITRSQNVSEDNRASKIAQRSETHDVRLRRALRIWRAVILRHRAHRRRIVLRQRFHVWRMRARRKRTLRQAFAQVLARRAARGCHRCFLRWRITARNSGTCALILYRSIRFYRERITRHCLQKLVHKLRNVRQSLAFERKLLSKKRVALIR